MLEEEVLSGRALLIFEAPPALRRSEPGLKDLFRSHLAGTPAADIKRCILNDDDTDDDDAIPTTTATTSNGNGNDAERPATELAAVEFFTAAGVRTVLERLEVTRMGRLGAMELRRGYITLGAERLLVEGILPAPPPQNHNQQQSMVADGVADPTQCPDRSPRVTAAAAVAVPATLQPPGVMHGSRNGSCSSTGGGGGPDKKRSTSPRSGNSRATNIAPARHFAGLTPPVAHVLSLRVALFDFKLLFSRRADSTPTNNATATGMHHGNKHSSGSSNTPKKDFPMSPFIVLLALRSIGHTPVAVRAGSRFHTNNTNQTPVFRMLVEFQTAAAAQRAVKELDDVVIDFKSPAMAAGPMGSGGASTEAALQAYARAPQLDKFPDWMERADGSNDRGQPFTGRLKRFYMSRDFLCLDGANANSDENSGGGGGGGDATVTKSGAELTEAELVRLLGKPYDSAWISPEQLQQQQQQQQQQMQQGQQRQPMRGHSSGQPSAVTNMHSGHANHINKSNNHSNGNVWKRQRDATPEGSGRATGGVSPRQQFQHQQQQQQMAAVLPAPAPVQPAAAAAFTNSPRHLQPQTHYSPQQQQQQAVAYAPVATTAAAVAIAVPPVANPQYLQPQQSHYPTQQPQQQQQAVAYAPVAPTTTAAVLAEPSYGAAHDTHGPLPIGWRAVFSDQYRQTYYVLHDTRTGQDTTTWTRPT